MWLVCLDWMGLGLGCPRQTPPDLPLCGKLCIFLDTKLVSMLCFNRGLIATCFDTQNGGHLCKIPRAECGEEWAAYSSDLVALTIFLDF